MPAGRGGRCWRNTLERAGDPRLRNGGMGWFKLPQATPVLLVPQAVPERSTSGPGEGVTGWPLLQQTEKPLNHLSPGGPFLLLHITLPSAAPQRPLSSSCRHKAWTYHGSQTHCSLRSLWRREQDSALLPGWIRRRCI